MGIRIPKNQTVESKYTSGGEYMFASTQNEYKGYYYELNNKTYAGKEFNTNNPEIIKIKSDKYNTLLGSAATYIYGIVSGVKLNNNKPTSIPLPSNPDVIDRNTLQFYCKKINSNIIKVIDEETFISLQKNPIYQTTFTGTYNNKTQTPDDAEQQMPGIKAFLGL
jgi:hypothetical protein